MTKRIQILPSGISLVDKTWGGFYRGGTYLLVVPKNPAELCSACKLIYT